MVAGLACGAPMLHAQLLVEPLEVVIVPGSAPTATFSVVNEGSRPVQASLAFEDWDRDETGQNRFYPLGKGPGSCGGTLRVFPQDVRIEPRERATIRVMLSETDSVRVGCWSVVFVENREPPSSASRQITFSVRTGVKIYVETPMLLREGAVEDMAIQPHLQFDNTIGRSVIDSTRRDAAVTFANTGDVQVRLHGGLEVRRLDNTVAAKVDLGEIPVLPGAKRIVRFEIPGGLAQGKYVLLALLDYGGGELAAAQLDYEVP